MNVETYEVISLDEQNGAVVNELVSEEALALIEALDLSGQRGLVQEQQHGAEIVATRIPYRQMSAEEHAIFGAILPRHVDLARYNDGPIPLRVLQVAAHAKDMFDGLMVWCPEKAGDPDPLLVGVNGYRSWSKRADETFILARWAEVLEPLDVLRAKARAIVAARVRTQLADAKARVGAFEAALDSRLDLYLLTGADDPQNIALSFAPSSGF